MKRPIVFVILAAMGAMLAAIVVFSAIRKRESEVQRAMAQTVQIVVAATIYRSVPNSSPIPSSSFDGRATAFHKANSPIRRR